MKGLQEFLEKTWYHNSLEDWAISLFYIFGAVILSRILYWFLNKNVKVRFENKGKTFSALLIDKIEEPLAFAIVIFGIWLGLERLLLPDGAQEFISKAYHVLIAINITWLFARLIDTLITHYIVPLADKSESTLDDNIIPVIRKGLNYVIWTLGIIVALNNAGYNVGALIAGLGIGGIALAMAAKDFVANIFGGITVFTDRPFKLKDRIQIGGYDGSVESIGLRTTKIRTLEGRVVTIPNHKFTDSFVENVTEEPSRKVILDLGLTYDTSPENIQEAMNILKKIVVDRPELEDDYFVGFNSFGDFSLGIRLIYYIRKGEDILGGMAAINLEILKSFNEKGLEFAFPTRTVINEVSQS